MTSAAAILPSHEVEQTENPQSFQFPQYASETYSRDANPSYESSLSSFSSTTSESVIQFNPKKITNFNIGTPDESSSPNSGSPSREHSPAANISFPYTPTEALPPSISIPKAVNHDQAYAQTENASVPQADSPIIGAAGTKVSSSVPIDVKHHRTHSSLSLFRRHRGDSTSSNSSQTGSTASSPHTQAVNPRTGSMVDLKRFFQKPWKSNVAHLQEFPPQRQSSSPGSSAPSSPKLHGLGGKPARSSSNLKSMMNNETKRSLAKTYGKLGKALGEGAGGNVRLVTRSKDNRVFAVKEFRQRQSYESARDYSKKVTAEYCIGLTLKHPNVVETVDIIYDSDKIYQVMEYCEFDLFAIVMSGKMSRAEIYCDFKQFLNGVKYMHECGLAHRDLKLDNCVINAQGIVKIIDFGSAVVFRYPETEKIHEAVGIVGSDPYLAPEVVTHLVYDPRSADVWSAAIVFCCMLMRKFPWKSPRLSDNSFKQFAAQIEPTESSSSALSGTTANASKPPSLPSTNHGTSGPSRLLKSLPVEVHPLILKMLNLDPEKRASIEACWNDEWLSSIKYCTLDKEGHLIAAPGHTHTTVDFDKAHIAPLEKSNKKKKEKEKMW